MQKIVDGVDVHTGHRVWTNVPEESAAFFKEVKATKSWSRYVSDFGDSSENNDIVLAVLDKLHGDSEYTTVEQFCDALNTAMDAGELQRLPEEPVIEQAPVPTDKNGRPLTPAQQKWSEYRQFSEANGMDAVRRRAREDADFAAFVHKNYEREFAEQPVGDVALNLNARPAPSGDQNIPELVAWVAAYRKLPVAEARKLSRADYNPAGFEHFNKMMNLAISGGLI